MDFRKKSRSHQEWKGACALSLAFTVTDYLAHSDTLLLLCLHEYTDEHEEDASLTPFQARTLNRSARPSNDNGTDPIPPSG